MTYDVFGGTLSLAQSINLGGGNNMGFFPGVGKLGVRGRKSPSGARDGVLVGVLGLPPPPPEADDWL